MTQTTETVVAARQRAREKAAAANLALAAAPTPAVNSALGNGEKVNGIVASEMVTLLQPPISPSGVSAIAHSEIIERACANGSDFV
jgi:hypothetical protein